MLKGLVFLFCLCFLHLNSWAGGKVFGNGGDPVAVEFVNAGTVALSDMMLTPERFPEIQGLSVLRVLKNAVILVSEEPLFAVANGIEQESVAINRKNPDTIVINRKSWNSIKSPLMKKAVVAHEVLSLVGLESTGNYRLSHRFLNHVKISCRHNDLSSCEELPSYECSLSKNTKSWPVAMAEGVLNGAVSKDLELSAENVKAQVRLDGNGESASMSLRLLYQGQRVAGSDYANNLSSRVRLSWFNIQTEEEWIVFCSL